MTAGGESLSHITIGATSALFEISVRALESSAGRALERWLDVWRADDPTSTVVGDVCRLTIPYSRWLEVGALPSADSEPEELDGYQAQHSALGRLAGIMHQRLSIETVGHIGAPDVSFLVAVNGHRLGDTETPIPFAKDGAGHAHPLLPCAFAAYERLMRFNARRTTTRSEQIFFVSELREHLERAAALLETAAVGFTFELAPHLNEFRAHRAGEAALGWKAQKNGKVFDLQLEHVAADGTRAPLDLDKLDAESPFIQVSATEHILLDPDLAAVARVAKANRNKLPKYAARHFANPASLIPEGVSLDKIDLSAYGPRVVGFAPIVRAERFIDIQSSMIEWYEANGASMVPFIRLEIAQTTGIESIAIGTPEEAEQAIERLAAALATSSPDLVAVGDRPNVQPTAALLQRLKQDVSTFRARGAAEASGTPPADTWPASGRVAAVIAEDSAPTAAPALEAPPDPVRWDVLDTLLVPGRSLKPHQRDGLTWLWKHYRRGQAGVLLADDMGLGKTLQLAAFLALQRAVEPQNEHSPSLIVCPVILLPNWQNELASFFRPAVFASLQVLYADNLRRMKKGPGLDLAGICGFDYILTNYETLQAYQQSLLMLDWNVVVLDEAHAIKNSDTYRARAARGLKRKFGICSTGTPVENRLGDLWGLYDFLSPGEPFTTLKSFEQHYESDVKQGVPAVRAALRYPTLESSLLRRTKAEVLRDLPPKTAVIHAVPMTPRQVAHERSIAKQGPIFKILQGLQKLYQHPRLLLPEGERSTGASLQQVLDESPKLALTMQILEDIQRKGEKALVFTLWTDMQDLLVEVVREKLGLRQVRVINGEPAQRRHALRYIEEFSRSDGFDVLVLSPLAAGTGLTITAANHVIHYGRWWNPAKEDQATDRAYRIGQTRPVHVHYPLLHHPGKPDVGFDVKLHGLVEGKRGMARDFLAPQSEEIVTMDDLKRLDAERDA